MATFARKGEEVRDEDGNLVLTFTRDVDGIEVITSDSFLLPNGEHPVSGEPLPKALWDFIAKRRGQPNG